MRLIRVFYIFVGYALVKAGWSLPNRYNWHGVWSERGKKVDCTHVASVDGRPSEDEINAVNAVIQQITRLDLLRTDGMWLDVGVGSGLMHSLLKEKSAKSTVSICCDYSLPSLCFCKKTHALSVVNCSAEKLPFSSACFDFILFYSVSHYLSRHKNLLAVITEFERVLKPGGAILVGDVLSFQELHFEHFNPNWYYPNFRKVKRDIQKLSLDITAVRQPECAPYRAQRVDWVITKSGKFDDSEAT